MNFDYQTILSQILPLLPASYAGDATTVVTAVIALAALVARFWPRPADGSKWLFLYKIINQIGMNGRHAANADDTKKN